LLACPYNAVACPYNAAARGFTDTGHAVKASWVFGRREEGAFLLAGSCAMGKISQMLDAAEND
jgi:hypothetical protein